MFYDKDGKPRIGRMVAIVSIIILALMTTFASFASVDAGERGILLTFGAVEEKILQPGINTIMPFTQTVIHMDVRTHKEETAAAAASKDLQIVSTTVALNYHIDPNKANIIYRDIGKEYKERVIDPAIQEAVKSSTAQYAAEELITKREIVKDRIRQELKTRLAIYNIIVEDISITNFDFSREFNAAIESKVTAEQLAFKAKNDLERIKIEAEQKVAEAKGQAEAVTTRAKAEAEAIKITAQALKENSQLIQLEAIKKWNGVMPVFVGSGTETPLIDITGIIQPK